MRRSFCEELEPRALPTASHPAVKKNTPPETRPEAASLSTGVISVAVVDLILGLFAAMVLSVFILRAAWSAATLLNFGMVLAVAVGAWGAALCLRKRRRIAWVFQCLPIVSAVYWGPASPNRWRNFPPAVGSEEFWLEWTFMVGLPLVFIGLAAYVGWLTRRDGEG